MVTSKIKSMLGITPKAYTISGRQGLWYKEGSIRVATVAMRRIDLHEVCFANPAQINEA